MASFRSPLFLASATLLSLAMSGLGAVSCGADKDDYVRAQVNSNADYNCLNGVCVEDPGSRAVSAAECAAAEDGLEFYPVPLWDYEGNKAIGSYSYDDDTVDNLEPKGWELTKDRYLHEKAPTIDPWARCGRADNPVLHVTGGPFLEWGGGVGRAMRCINNATPPIKPNNYTDTSKGPYAIAELWNYYCSPPTQGTACTSTDPLIASTCPERDLNFLESGEVMDEERALLGQALDLSEWEGISFWARRGPNSQTGFRVLVGDRYTDDDISFIQYLVDPAAERNCERVIECACKDQTKSCTELTEADFLPEESDETWPDGSPKDAVNFADANALAPTPGVMACYNRGADPLIDNVLASNLQICGNSACGWPTSSAKSLNAAGDNVISYGSTVPRPDFRDLQFVGTQCLDYSFRGSITTAVCYDPNSSDPRVSHPAEGSETCGDHWMHSTGLTYDWAFYKVPFTALLQQGWAKRSYLLDLTAITLARITWGNGFVDFYIDDVRFYRKQQ